MNVLPLNCVIVFLGWTGFAIPIEDVADRLSVIITLLLTSTAFKYVITEKLPRIDYPTQLDYYMLTGMFLLLLQGLFHVAAQLLLATAEESSWLANTGNMRAVEMGGLVVLFLIFAASNFRFWLFRRSHWRIQKLGADEMAKRLQFLEETKGMVAGVETNSLAWNVLSSDGESEGGSEGGSDSEDNDQDAELDALSRRNE